MTAALPSSVVPIWKHILAPTDLSPAAASGLEAAAELARDSAARVTVLHVIDFSALGDPGLILRESLLRIERELRQDAMPRLEELCKQLFKDVPIEIEIVESVLGASVSIAQYARDHAVDLIVLASHGRTGFKRAVLGSVAERVVRSAPCDVLVVRSRSEDEEGK